MAPPPNHSHLTPLPLPLPHRPLRRCSKAQMSFFNILRIISILPTNDVTDHQNHDNRELAADVNLRLHPPSPATAVSDNCEFEKNDRCESDNNSSNRLSELNVADEEEDNIPRDEICDNREVVADVNLRLRPPSPSTAVGENCVFEKHVRCESESVVADESELAVEVSDKSSVDNNNNNNNNNNRASELNVEEEEEAAARDEICDNRELVADVSYNYVFEKNDRCKIESELAVEDSEISHVGDHSSSVDNNNNRVKPRDEEGYLSLLIEAAELILAEDSVSELKPKPLRRSKSKALVTARRGVKRKTQCWTAAAEAEWYAEFEEASPVVKSRRGRNQVLPYKYRDSVVERWPSEISIPLRRRSK